MLEYTYVYINTYINKNIYIDVFNYIYVHTKEKLVSYVAY